MASSGGASITDESPGPRPSRSGRSTRVPIWPASSYVIRLTAPEACTASRSYSIASAPHGAGEVDFTVERLDDGEVSAFLHDVEPGDEVRSDARGRFSPIARVEPATAG